MARCISASGACLCKGAEIVLDGTVASLDDSNTSFDITAESPPTDGGTRIPIFPRVPADKVGQRWLLLLTANQELLGRSLVNDEGKVVCEYADPPNFEIDAADAITLALSTGCDSGLKARGLREPRCNDTCSCSQFPSAFACIVLLIAFARRR